MKERGRLNLCLFIVVRAEGQNKLCSERHGRLLCVRVEEQ